MIEYILTDIDIEELIDRYFNHRMQWDCEYKYAIMKVEQFILEKIENNKINEQEVIKGK
jgi:hypothetical protein